MIMIYSGNTRPGNAVPKSKLESHKEAKPFIKEVAQRVSLTESLIQSPTP